MNEMLDELIKTYLRSTPGLSAQRILDNYKKDTNHQIIIDRFNMHLRKLKKNGILINKGNRWYLNMKSIQKQTNY